MAGNTRRRRTGAIIALALGTAALVGGLSGMAGAHHTDVHVDAPQAEVTFAIPVKVDIASLTGPFRVCIGTTCVDQNTAAKPVVGTLYVTLVGDQMDTAVIDVNDDMSCPDLSDGTKQEGVVATFVATADVIDQVRAEFVPTDTSQAPVGVAANNPEGARRGATVTACTHA